MAGDVVEAHQGHDHDRHRDGRVDPAHGDLKQCRVSGVGGEHLPGSPEEHRQHEQDQQVLQQPHRGPRPGARQLLFDIVDGDVLAAQVGQCCTQEDQPDEDEA